MTAKMRGLFAALLGAVTAVGLFWVMQALVGVKYKTKDIGVPLSVNWVPRTKDTPPEVEPPKVPEWQKPEAPPPPPPMDPGHTLDPGEAVEGIPYIMDVDAQLDDATSLGGGDTNRDVVPLVRVDPDYPPRARQRGIEGWVEVEFTISPVGTVTDAVVVGARPPFIFDRAALQAVRKWKYHPKIENGVPVALPGVMVRLRFDLDQGRQ